MPEIPSNTNPSTNIPPMTALSIAFPMTFETVNPTSPDPRRVTATNSNPTRPTHRHDAGE
tara:strand:- start:623084 stop:623263 length:180 start_codon:yes stop_codon:yes gene_type:complete